MNRYPKHLTKGLPQKTDTKLFRGKNKKQKKTLTAPAPELTATHPEVADWPEGLQVPSAPIQQFPTGDWSAQPSTEDWSAAPTAQAAEWAGTTTEWS